MERFLSKPTDGDGLIRECGDICLVLVDAVYCNHKFYFCSVPGLFRMRILRPEISDLVEAVALWLGFMRELKE